MPPRVALGLAVVLGLGALTGRPAWAEPRVEKVSCPTQVARDERDLLGGPFVQRGPRPIPHLLGGMAAHTAEFEACYARFPAASLTAPGLAFQLELLIGRGGEVREVELRGAPDTDFSACVVASVRRWRYPPACGDLRITLPFSAKAFTRSLAAGATWPGFWEWSDFEVGPEDELTERAAVARRLLRNLRLGQAEQRFTLGASSFALQRYARQRSAAELRARQKETLAGFAGLLQEAPNHPRRAEALLALIVTLCDLEQSAQAEVVYRRLLTQHTPTPTPRELGWAHLAMAERAARAGERVLADERYARVLAALPAEERAYAFAYARRLQNARAP